MSRRESLLKDFYIKNLDDPYVFEPLATAKSSKVLERYEYFKPNVFLTPKVFDKDGLPIGFRALPEKLIEITVNHINKLPLPSVYTWDIEYVCRWLRNYGYPQYQNTFRENLVNGRSLLLLDASALSAINIKDFDHIRHIAYGIRCLFHFELAKFARSISLPPEGYLELYKLMRVKNGRKYEVITQPADLWRHMQLLRPAEALEDHWETLERWLRHASDSKSKEIIGSAHRHELYRCKPKAEREVYVQPQSKPCTCVPPCECFWTERETRSPWTLQRLGTKRLMGNNDQVSVLSILQYTFPDRYRNESTRNTNSSKTETYSGTIA